MSKKNLLNYDRLPDDNGSQVYVHKRTGNIYLIYPQAPKWAQRAAFRIWKDIEACGQPTRKGVKDVVRGTWGYMIAEEARRK